MKKIIYLLPLAAIAMASCSNVEEGIETSPQVKNTELKVFPQVQGSTRGAIATSATISDFKLIANGKFAESATATEGVAGTYVKEVTKSGSTWSIGTTPLYWGDAATSASFTAFSPKDAGNYESGKLSFVVGNTAAAQKDLIVAFNSGTQTDFASGVPLHFQHALAQVLVNATYTTDANYPTFPALKVNVKSVKFVNVDKTGTLTLPTSSTVSGYTAAWALSGTNTASSESARSASLLLGSTADLIDNSAADGPMLLLPQEQTATTNLGATSVTGSYMMVQVDIDYVEAKATTGDNKIIDLYPKGEEAATPVAKNEFAWIAVPVNIDWKAGYKYTYTLNFSNIACGKAAPGATVDKEGKAAGDPVISGVKTPVNFLVTVESEWTEQTIPAM